MPKINLNKPEVEVIEWTPYVGETVITKTIIRKGQRIQETKYVEDTVFEGGSRILCPKVLVTSPPGGSTLITFAPKSFSKRVHHGPARTRVRSKTVMLDNGPSIFVFPDIPKRPWK